jgi:hypothetical protein
MQWPHWRRDGTNPPPPTAASPRRDEFTGVPVAGAATAARRHELHTLPPLRRACRTPPQLRTQTRPPPVEGGGPASARFSATHFLHPLQPPFHPSPPSLSSPPTRRRTSAPYPLYVLVRTFRRCEAASRLAMRSQAAPTVRPPPLDAASCRSFRTCPPLSRRFCRTRPWLLGVPFTTDAPFHPPATTPLPVPFTPPHLCWACPSARSPP